ncbi:MAG: alginate lyase family protein, partial [Rhodocyclales bacterium]|nr:alginate lyase family protein [Rhodocyclales bacterium]
MRPLQRQYVWLNQIKSSTYKDIEMSRINQETNNKRFVKTALVAAIALASASAFALSTTLPPGKNFSLGGFSLQLPTGSSGNIDTETGAQLTAGFTKSPWYYTDTTDGAMVMGDPSTGWTTSGSLHPRTELRENAEWAT